MNIDFIYFDVGGVAVLDFSKTNKWNELLDSLHVREKDRHRLDYFFDKEENKFCIGEKSVETFKEVLKKEFDLKIPDNYSLLDDFVNRFESNPSLGEIIRNLKNNYHIGLLTNMYPDMLNRIKARGLLPEIKWDVILDSSIVGLAKPQNEIYKLACETAQKPPHKVLLVDNTQANLISAQKMGWNILLYDPSDIETSNKNLLEELI